MVCLFIPRSAADVSRTHDPVLVHQTDAARLQVFEVDQFEDEVAFAKELVCAIVLGNEPFGTVPIEWLSMAGCLAKRKTMTAIACLTEIQNIMSHPSTLNWLTLFALLVALFAIFMQSRATEKQLKLQSFSDYTKRYQEIILNFPESINEGTFSLDGLASKDLRDKTLRYMRAYFDLCYEEYILHKRRAIDATIWDDWKSGMTFAFSKPAFSQAWAIISRDTDFGSEFNDFVDRSIGTKR